MSLIKEKTLVILKPDAVQRNLIGEILKRFENKGLKISAMKFVVGTEEQCFEHYNKDDEWFLRKGKGIVADLEANNMPVDREPIEYGKDIIRNLAHYMTAGPMVAIVLEGLAAVEAVRKMVGETEPVASDVGTIRGDYGLDNYALATIDDRGVRNLIHCSESTDEANREIKIWFDESEIIDYKTLNEKMLYDVNLDGIME
tara:strand:+ start:104 stop:703 length:600 start_codon:yes stop_codon:yes gene_type:complete